MSEIYILIGPPASGKTTWADEHFEAQHIVSSDRIRKFVYGDESIQGNPWPFLYDMLKMKLEAQEDQIVIDATNVKRRDRRRLINFIRTHATDEFTLIGVIFYASKETLIERNLNRDRVVPDEVIHNMYNAFQSVEPSYEEGFDKFIRIE